MQCEKNKSFSFTTTPISPISAAGSQRQGAEIVQKGVPTHFLSGFVRLLRHTKDLTSLRRFGAVTAKRNS